MKSRRLLWMVIGALVLLTPAITLATNGTNLIGIGPYSRSMGGVGIASPQDAIGAVFSNPAAMCFGAFCPSSEVEFAGTMFMPTVKGQISSLGQTFNAKSEGRVYPIPATGVSFGFPELPKWRFGLGAYGISGLGVNYKGSSLDQSGFYATPIGAFPLAAGTFTDLMVMKFAPTAAYQVNDWLSVGAAFNVAYSTLDLGQGNGANYGWGAQFGVIVKPMDKVSVGLTYVTPQGVNYRKVADLDSNGSWDNLTLESPHTLGFGVAYEPIYRKLLFEVDVKWLNWSGAQGYRDFGWKDQLVVGVGAQYRPIPKLALRMGYNYGNNPLQGQNFNGPGLTTVQGKAIPNYYYQTFRIIGFQAITEHHVTLGGTYDVTERFSLTFGYVHSFRNTVSSNGTNIFGLPATISAALYENALDLGLTWRF
jgi:long-chain fatty acid transport protein